MVLSAAKSHNATAPARMIELLNRILRLEYSLIIHYPRLAATISNKEARHGALELGTASVRHADTVAKAITGLGGVPDWSFEPFPDDPDPLEIFQGQLEKERLASELHRQSADLAPDTSLRNKFLKLAKEEQSHVHAVERILSILRQGNSRVPDFF